MITNESSINDLSSFTGVDITLHKAINVFENNGLCECDAKQLSDIELKARVLLLHQAVLVIGEFYTKCVNILNIYISEHNKR